MSLDFNELENNKVDAEIIDFLAIQNECYVDLSEEMIAPEIILSIGEHEYKQKMYPTAVMTAGEFSAIIAVSKAKKSFLKSAFIGCYIGGNSNVLFGNIKSHREQDFTILDFDTEQGKYYAQRTFRRVQDITERKYDNYKCYATRQLTSLQRLQLIDYCLKNQDALYKTPVKLVSDVLSEFPRVSNEDITLALRSGSLGKYGRTFKLSTQEVCFWIREYQKSKTKKSLI